MGLILLRHTTPEVQPGTCYGQLDLDVAATFKAEAEKAYRALPAIDRIVTSPLKRCRTLAQFIADRKQLSLEEDLRLMEMDFGAWEGTPWDDIPRAEID
ncbi:MAG: histidine phosphatase family protein, partial [Pseudomonadota bacterium]